MTKSTITRERLQELAAGQSGFNLRTATHEESQELARIALAAMDSEPVAYIDKQWTLVYYVPPMSMGLKIGDKLYRHAQPAPVVPDEIKHRIGGLDWGWEGEFNRGWNACRAAMLAAAPQSPSSEPATVPGKWIPVSERMPEVGDIVLTAMGGVVNVGEMECSAANCRFFTSVISGRELPATHWMPLPAGPQEVK